MPLHIYFQFALLLHPKSLFDHTVAKYEHMRRCPAEDTELLKELSQSAKRVDVFQSIIEAAEFAIIDAIAESSVLHAPGRMFN